MSEVHSAPNHPIRYAAFLRGINLGGRRLKMDQLTRVFAEAGFDDVRTVIASGNVLFTSDQTDVAALTEAIERSLTEALGYEVKVILRTIEHLQALVRLDPFKEIDDSAATKSYVTFLAQRPTDVPPLPVHVPEEYFTVLGMHESEVFTVVYKRPDGPRYGDSSTYVDKTFGKASTTRNWNTVVKMAAL